MREAKNIDNSFLHYAQSEDLSSQVQLDGENPFIEDDSQICTRHGYLYKIWRIREAVEAQGITEKKICIRCSVHSHTGVTKENGEK